MDRRRFIHAASAVVAASLLPISALAHHGWSWTEDEFVEIDGVITAIYLGNPHATLDVEAEGGVWRVELAPPRQTRNAGFTEESAQIGDKVLAIGHRSRNAEERVLKAVRIIVNGASFDVYPGRVPTN